MSTTRILRKRKPSIPHEVGVYLSQRRGELVEAHKVIVSFQKNKSKLTDQDLSEFVIRAIQAYSSQVLFTLKGEEIPKFKVTHE